MPQVCLIDTTGEISFININNVVDCIDILNMKFDDKGTVSRCLEDEDHIYEIIYKLDKTSLSDYNELVSKLIYNIDDVFGKAVLVKNKFFNDTFDIVDISENDVKNLIEIRTNCYGTLVKTDNSIHLIELTDNDLSNAREVNLHNLNISFIFLYNNNEINEYISTMLRLVMKGDVILFFKLQNGVMPVAKKFIINFKNIKPINDMKKISIPALCNN